MKKFLAAALAAISLSLTGCSFGGQNTPPYNVMNEYDFKEMELIQLEPPKDGDTIAVFDTSMGEIRMVLYPEYCPNTVAAFIEKANTGEYNNIDVYGIMGDQYFLSGGKKSEDGTYTGRENDDELIDNECNVNLWPFKGAIMSFSEKPGFSDSRWFICNTEKEALTEDAIQELKDSAAKREDEVEREKLINLFDKFIEVGGLFGAAGTYTVFGQTYEGLDVIEKICAVPVDELNAPKQQVTINSVTISEYTAE